LAPGGTGSLSRSNSSSETDCGLEMVKGQPAKRWACSLS